MLPSEALCHATTFDLEVLDISTKYSIEKQQQLNNPKPKAIALTQEQMREMIDKVKKKK